MIWPILGSNLETFFEDHNFFHLEYFCQIFSYSPIKSRLVTTFSGTKSFSDTCKRRTQSIGTILIDYVWFHCADFVIRAKNVTSLEFIIVKAHSAMMNITSFTFPIDDISQHRLNLYRRWNHSNSLHDANQKHE